MKIGRNGTDRTPYGNTIYLYIVQVIPLQIGCCKHMLKETSNIIRKYLFSVLDGIIE